MLGKLQQFISENNLLRDGERVLLTVSGGIDSMAMSHLFLQLPYSIGIAHCNFRLRGNDSDLDEKLVKEFCSSNNIPFFRAGFDTVKYAEGKGISIQMAARELRYAWFEEVRLNERYDRIATAHNLNDNIETIIINLVRGSGLTGLSGIRSSSGFIIRPLLFATRESIAKYCSINRVIYREDKSNSEVKYIRNKIRHLVIPVLKEINPSVEDTLMETADRFRDMGSLLNDYIKLVRERISVVSGDQVIFDQAELKASLQNRTLMFELFRIYGIKSTHIKDLVNIIDGRTGGYLLTESHRILKNRNEIIVTPFSEGAGNELIFNNLEELKSFTGFSTEVIRIASEFVIPKDNNIACVDAEKIEFPLSMRNWAYGDKFIPLGMSKPKKLSDYFIDRKYSIPDKEKKKVLVSGGNIIWIAGDIIDNRYRITSSTSKAMILRLKQE